MFLHDKGRAGRYVRSLFLKETMGAYAIRPYPDGRKGAVSLFVVGRGRGVLARIGFFELLGR